MQGPLRRPLQLPGGYHSLDHRDCGGRRSVEREESKTKRLVIAWRSVRARALEDGCRPVCLACALVRNRGGSSGCEQHDSHLHVLD